MTSKKPISPPVERCVAVQIRGDGTHAGRFGHVRYVNGLPQYAHICNKKMIYVTFEDGDGCYVGLHDISQVASPPARPKVIPPNFFK